MRESVVAAGAIIAALLCSLSPASAADPIDPALQQAIDSPSRTPKSVARDPARHPAEELTFLGLRPDQSVVEIWPEGGYWTEILAPYLRANGKLYAAIGDGKQAAAIHAKFDAAPALYDRVSVTELSAREGQVAPDGSADLVLTFRNLHNWLKAGYANSALAAFYRALKPGGILGIEEHRARPDKPQDPQALSGYVREDYTIALAQKAGFELVAGSEINANPKDTTDWPKGVWTLPPTFALGEVDRDKYQAIGEADNFVLKFRKPAQ